MNSKNLIENLSELAINASKGHGSVVLIAGESGYGKTFLVNNLVAKFNSSNTNIAAIYSENEAPIGKFVISNIQPLRIYAKVIEAIVSGNGLSAEKKLALNVGMTLLASIPFLGEIPYAVKEIGKDWRQYKQDKTNIKKQEDNLVQDYLDAIISFTQKSPLLIVMEDMQWADSQTIILTEMLAERIKDLPICLVLSYRKSEIDLAKTPFYNFLKSDLNRESFIHSFALEPFTKRELTQYIAENLTHYAENTEFEEFIYERSYGVPGVMNEYLHYFERTGAFDSKGHLKVKLDANKIPISSNSALAQALQELSDDEKNLLCICSAEGRQFTTTIISHLLKTDVLTTIKRLRSLQEKTGIIRSIGAHNRYGIKTTIYEFTQAFYQKYFEEKLEYEEYVSLHSEIARFLKEQYDNTDNPDLKRELVPYLTAHTLEAGETEDARKLFLENATLLMNGNDNKASFESVIKNYEDLFAKESGLTKTERIKIKEEFDKLISIQESTSETLDSGSGVALNNKFITTRRNLIQNFNNGKLEQVVSVADNILSQNEEDFNFAETIQVLMILTRAYIELGDYEMAEQKIKLAEELNAKYDDAISKCLILNTNSTLQLALEKQQMALELLKKAAQLSLKLPTELRLLTMFNIAKVLEQSDTKLADKYRQAAIKLASNLKFSSILKNLV